MALLPWSLKGVNPVNIQWIAFTKCIVVTTFTKLDYRMSKATTELNYEQSSLTHLCNGVLRLPSLLSMTTPCRTRSSTSVKWPCFDAKWSGDLDATQSMASMSAPCRNSKSTTPSWPPTQATWRAVVPSLSLSLTKSLKEVNRLEAYGKEKNHVFNIRLCVSF